MRTFDLLNSCVRRHISYIILQLVQCSSKDQRNMTGISLEISRLRETVVEKLLAKLFNKKRAKGPLQHPIVEGARFRVRFNF